MLAVIGVGVGGLWAGLSSIAYNPDGSAKIPFLAFIPKFPIDLSPTVPMNVTENQTDYDWQGFLNSNPLMGIINALGYIANSVVNWISSPMQLLFESLLHMFCPSCTLPSVFGMLTTLLILIVFAFLTYGTFVSIAGRIVTIALVIISIIVFAVLMLSFLGLMH